MRFLWLLFVAADLAAVNTTLGQCQTLLDAVGGADADLFGTSVFIDGDTLIVGASGHDTPAFGAGAAYVFVRDAGTMNAWNQVAQLTPDDAASSPIIGTSVGLDGDTAVVGAQLDGEVALNAGSVYVFQRDVGGPAMWGQVAKRIGSMVGEAHIFGQSVAIDGDTVVVGAQGDDWAGAQSGAAYVFERDDGGPDQWGEVKRLTAPDGAAFARFGNAAAISGDLIVIGARGDDGRGAAYVFARDEGGPGQWGFVAKLVSSDGAVNELGWSVAIDGDVVAAGAPFDDDMAVDAGAAYLFARDHGGPDAWGQLAKVWPCAGNPPRRLGRGVGLADGTLLVTGVSTFGPSIGQANVYRQAEADTTLWVLTHELASDVPGDHFGWSASLSGETALVGADDQFDGPGSVYVHDLASCVEVPFVDCQRDGLGDFCTPFDLDCNGNDVPDACDFADGTSDDCNANGVPDECDIAAGRSADCNFNGIPDACDLADGTSVDRDRDGIPDDCQGCFDIDGDAVVSTTDLLMLLAAWGQPGSPADLNGDGTVSLADLLLLLSVWGPCA